MHISGFKVSTGADEVIEDAVVSDSDGEYLYKGSVSFKPQVT